MWVLRRKVNGFANGKKVKCVGGGGVMLTIWQVNRDDIRRNCG